MADVNSLGIAFKEWAVIGAALAAGKQALILRKGGIAEEGGAFRVEHSRFWLYPTFAHQQAAGVVPAAAELLESARRDRPPEGRVRLDHFAEVARVYRVEELDKVSRLAGLHLWSPATVEARFHYREPGLFVLPVRVYRAAAHELNETPAYAGCKSWVELEQELVTGEPIPVLDDTSFAVTLATLDRLLGG
jgi:hypothetical protein